MYRYSLSARSISDASIKVGVWLSGLTLLLVFIALLAHLLVQGWSQLSIEFLLSKPEQAGRSGGIGPILVSTFWIVVVCLVTCIPVGLGCAVFFSEFGRRSPRLARAISVSLDILAGVPSIVFGLFGNAFFCIILGMGFSILSGGLTLACMALPLFVRTVEEGFRMAPVEYRNGAAALGLSRWTAFRHVLLPMGMPAIAIGLILSVGRALAETAALIFTSGYVMRTPDSLFDSGRALSVHIYDLAMNVPGGEGNAYASALILLVAILVINQLVNRGANLWKRFQLAR